MVAVYRCLPFSAHHRGATGDAGPLGTCETVRKQCPGLLTVCHFDHYVLGLDALDDRLAAALMLRVAFRVF